MASKRKKPQKGPPKSKVKKAATPPVRPQTPQEPMPMPPEEGSTVKIGRPPKLENTEFVRNLVFNLGRMQCTVEEAAATLGVVKNTFRSFLLQNPEIDEAWKMGPLAGRASLRQRQWASANKGNVQMQKWLGKQYLGQSEKLTVANNGNNQAPSLAQFYGQKPQS